MAIRKIVKLGLEGEDALSKKCKPVGELTKRTEELLDDLIDTLYDSGGVGLAAPQVGVLRRMAVIDIGEGLIVLIDHLDTRQLIRQFNVFFSSWRMNYRVN